MTLNIQIISTWIGIVITLGTVIWRVAAIASDVRNNRKDINGLGKKVHNIEESFNVAINKYDDKLQKAVDRLDDKITEMGAEINNVSCTLARIEGSLNATKDM